MTGDSGTGILRPTHLSFPLGAAAGVEFSRPLLAAFSALIGIDLTTRMSLPVYRDGETYTQIGERPYHTYPLGVVTAWEFRRDEGRVLVTGDFDLAITRWDWSLWGVRFAKPVTPLGRHTLRELTLVPRVLVAHRQGHPPVTVIEGLDK